MNASSNTHRSAIPTYRIYRINYIGAIIGFFLRSGPNGSTFFCISVKTYSRSGLKIFHLNILAIKQRSSDGFAA